MIKKLLFSCLFFISMAGFGQLSPSGVTRIQDSTTIFTDNLSNGWILMLLETDRSYKIINAIDGSDTTFAQLVKGVDYEDFVSDGGVTGDGTTGKVARFSGANSIEDGGITDNSNANALTIDVNEDVTVSNNLFASKIIGGTTTTSDLFLQTTSGVGTTGADMHFLVGNNGATEAMTILNSGNVGIGTTNPGAKLDIQNNAELLLNMARITTTTGAGYQRFVNSEGNYYFGMESSVGNRVTTGGLPYAFVMNSESAYPIQFGTNNNARVIIDSDGNVGIGTNFPQTRLHSVGNITVGDSTSADNDYNIYFATDGSFNTKYFKWDDGASEFQLSDDLNLSSNNIDGNVATMDSVYANWFGGSNAKIGQSGKKLTIDMDSVVMSIEQPIANNSKALVTSNTIFDAIAAVSGMTYPDAGIAVSTGSAWGTSLTDNSTNWNTAYTDRLKWDGGSTGLVAATGRTSLGATTVGDTLFRLPNPSAITFLRINADNSATLLSASNFRTAIGAGTSSTVGTVTSVAALTLGTAGTDLSSTVADGTTTPVITLQVPTASAINRGALSPADWSTFNNKIGTEIDPVFAADSAAIVHWSDTTLKIATQFDISGFGTGTITGSGTTGIIPYFSASTTLADSPIKRLSATKIFIDKINVGDSTSISNTIQTSDWILTFNNSEASNWGVRISTDKDFNLDRQYTKTLYNNLNIDNITGDWTMETKVNAKSFNATQQTLSSSSNAISFNVNSGANGKVTSLDEATTFTFSNLSAGMTGTIVFIQDAGGTNTVTFAGYTIETATGNISPTVSTTGSATTVVSYYYDGAVLYLTSNTFE